MLARLTGHRGRGVCQAGADPKLASFLISRCLRLFCLRRASNVLPFLCRFVSNTPASAELEGGICYCTKNEDEYDW